MAVDVKPVHEAGCHCGAVRLRLTLPNGLEELRRCDCSICRMRGTIVATVALTNLEVIAGQEALSLYQFNTMTAKHYFCRTCGIYTHHQRRSNPTQFGFNVACLDGVYPYDIENVPVEDGIHHPSDQD
jgi:hypothetical protein